MKPTLFIHIGTHKTGTTSIQHHLNQYRDKLRGCDICVPFSGRISEFSGHHNIAWQIRADYRYSSRLSGIMELCRELRETPCSRAVISSEDFEYLSQSPLALKEFDDLVSSTGFLPVYLVMFRERKAYAKSLHKELVKSGFQATFDELWTNVVEYGFVTARKDWFFEFDQRRFCERWQAIVQRNLVVMSYDLLAETVGVVPAFFANIGAERALVDVSRDAPRLNVAAGEGASVLVSTAS